MKALAQARSTDTLDESPEPPTCTGIVLPLFLLAFAVDGDG